MHWAGSARNIAWRVSNAPGGGLISELGIQGLYHAQITPLKAGVWSRLIYAFGRLLRRQ
jgi:hypothetical protein